MATENKCLVMGSEECLKHHGDPHGPLFITVDIVSSCNKKCSFCEYYKPDGKIMGPQVQASVLKFIQAVSEGRKPLRVLLFGGEPTLMSHRDLYALCYQLHIMGAQVYLQSNFSQSDEYYAALLHHVDRLILTYHIDDQTDPNVYKKFKALAEASEEINRRHAVEIFFMFSNESLRKSLPLYEEMKTLFPLTELHFLKTEKHQRIDAQWLAYWKSEAKHYVDEHKILVKYGDREKKIYTEFFWEVYPEDVNAIKECSAGQQCLYINTDGDIFPCDVRKLLGKPMGNVNHVDTTGIVSLAMKVEPCHGIRCSRDYHVVRSIPSVDEESLEKFFEQS